MYKEITIDPACMAEFEYYTLLKTSFGFEKGRYLTVSIREWVMQAVKEIKSSSMTPIKQKSVKNFLNQLQRDKRNTYALLSFQRRNVANEEATNWIEWQDKQSIKKPFSAVLSDSDLPESICYSDVLDDHEKWRIPPTVQSRKTANEIYNVIRPIIELSRVVTIVDPYFNLANNPVLHKILSECQSNLSLKSIKLVTTINTNNPEKVFENEYKKIFSKLPNFELIVLNDTKYIHDRYLYSDTGCIKAGHGFSVSTERGAQSDLTSFSLAGIIEVKDLHQQIELLIANGNALHKVLHNRVTLKKHLKSKF